MRTNSEWMLIRQLQYRRLHVADCLLRRLLDTGDGDVLVVTMVGQFPIPDGARLLAREWLALDGCPAGERETDPAVEGVAT